MRKLAGPRMIQIVRCTQVAGFVRNRAYLQTRHPPTGFSRNQLRNQTWDQDDAKCRATFTYTVGVRAAGHVTLPGVRLTLQDRYGFLRMHRFVRVEQKFRLLPDYFQSAELRPTIKRQNSLPQHGIHRMQRSGTGAELLELREYVPGDPPKSIAWKVSARRDKLMTRKYESEVPVRVHLFIDGSFSTRIGGYGLRLIDQINFVAASVAKAAISVGDPVSAMLVDENSIRRLPWAGGDRGFMQLLKALAEFSQTAPPASLTMTNYLMQCALRVTHERFPELLSVATTRFRLVFLHRRVSAIVWRVLSPKYSTSAPKSMSSASTTIPSSLISCTCFCMTPGCLGWLP